MNRRIIFVVLAATLVMAAGTAALAHDGSCSETYCGCGIENSITTTHDETVNNPDNLYCGWYTVYATNSTGVAWTDFHFVLPSGYPGTDDSGVVFDDTGAATPTSSQSGLSWVMPNQQEIDLNFPSDPVAPGNVATFAVWTDNQANDNPLFAVLTYPTDTATVPEPSSLLALAGSLLGFGFAFKKRS